MLHFPSWKIWSIVLTCFVTVLLAVPSFLPNPAFQQLPTWAQNIRVNLGLDLAGGSHLRCSRRRPATSPGSVSKRSEDTIRREMRRARIQVAEVLDQRRPAKLRRPRFRPSGAGAGNCLRADHADLRRPARLGGQRNRQPVRAAADPGRARQGRRQCHGRGARDHRPPHQRARHARGRPSFARAATVSSSRFPACRTRRRSRR